MKNNTIQKLIEAIEKDSGLDTIPEGWYTGKQLQAAMGLSEAQAGKKVRACVQAGSVMMKKYKINVNGVIRPVPHYKTK